MSTVISNYLEALAVNRPKRGRRRTADTVQKRLRVIDTELENASALARLLLIQEQMDLRNELQNLDKQVDLSALEAEFAQVAQAYGDAKGISPAAWKAMGVPAEVLAKANITR